MMINFSGLGIRMMLFSAVKEAIQDVENERKNRRGSKVLSIMSPSYEVA